MVTGSLTGAQLHEVVRSLGQAIDTDRDGRLSNDEFRSLLSRTLGEVIHDRRDPGLASPRSASGVVLDGFDVAKLADPGVTLVKYRFGRVAQHYDLSMVRDQASAQVLLRSMTADLETAGVTVLGVRQNQIRVRDDQGQAAWIRVIRQRADGTGAFQWHDLRLDQAGSVARPATHPLIIP